MSTPENDRPTAQPGTDLAAELQALRSENAALKADRWAWGQILLEISRGFQGTSASIKAAVSSLLNHDIFWDPANQYEFLQTINSSVDDLAQLAFLLAMASRIDAESLDLRLEDYALPELVMAACERARRRQPGMVIDTELPEGGRLVRANFEYLTLALSLLLDVAMGRQSRLHLRVEAFELDGFWHLTVCAADDVAAGLVGAYFERTAESMLVSSALPAQSALKLYVVREVFARLGVRLVVGRSAEQAAEIRLRFTNPPGAG